MKQNMKQWLDGLKHTSSKKPMPILSFPTVQLLGCTVKEITSDSALQARGMKLVADKADTAASVSLMDLSVEAECFGAQINITDDEVPTVIGRKVTDAESAEALTVPSVGCARSGIYIDAIRQATQLITDRPVFAGIIGPFSLAARLMDVTEIMVACYDDPDTVHTVLEKCTQFLIEYCNAYKQAGANGVVMAEPVTGLLSPTLAEEFSEPYVRQIVEAVQDDTFIVIYHNCGDRVVAMIDSILATKAAAYHFGNAIDMGDMLGRVPEDTVVMGNIDPVAEFCNGTPSSIREKTLDLMNRCAIHPNFVISSGCDIPPRSAWENIGAFFDAAKEYYES